MFNQQVITIPPELQKDFDAGKHIPPGKSRTVKIIWDKVHYDATLGYRVRKVSKPYYQIQWGRAL